MPFSFSLKRRAFCQTMASGAGLLLRPGIAASAPKPRIRLSTYKGAYTSFMDAAGQAPDAYAVDNVYLPFDASLRGISNGSIDIGINFTDVPMAFWGHALEGARIVAIAHNIVTPSLMRIVVPHDSPCRDVADLRAKSVAYLKASNQHYFLLKTLDKAGMSFSDIRPVAIPLDFGPAAFQSGRVDAWIVQGVYAMLAETKYGARTVITASEYVGHSSIILSAQALQDDVRRGVLRDLIGRFDRTLKWIGRNPASWSAESARVTGVGADNFLAMAAVDNVEPWGVGGISDAILREEQEVVTFLLDRKAISNGIDMASLWDGRFLSDGKSI